MKTLKLVTMFLLLVSGTQLMSQSRTLPDLEVYTLEGNRISTSKIVNNNESVVLFFWKAADQRSLDQLAIINEGYEKQIKGGKVKVIGICTDCPGMSQNIKPFLNGNEISIEVYLDKNNDLKRALNVPETPYTMILNREKNDNSRITGFCENIVDIITDRFDISLAGLTGK